MGSSSDCKNVVLKIEGYVGSRLPHEWNDRITLGPVIHVVADPLLAYMYHVNESDLQKKTSM